MYHAKQLLSYLDDRPLAYHDEIAWFMFDEFQIL